MPCRAKIKPIHPGEILEEEYLRPLGLTKYQLAKDTGMPADRVGRIVRGTRGITADTAVRLARYFRTTPKFWLNLQARYDLDRYQDEHGDAVEREVTPYRAA
jgi:addiction module HigA family antidote